MGIRGGGPWYLTDVSVNMVMSGVVGVSGKSTTGCSVGVSVSC